METPNLKLYIGISAGLLLILIFIIIFPFGKKQTPNNLQPTIGFPTPTSVKINFPTENQKLTITPADFTGVAEVTIPQPTIDAANLKRSLRQKMPLTLSTFSLDFNYGEDKFIVTLKDPKEAAKKEFESWRTANYPGIEMNQFNFQ